MTSITKNEKGVTLIELTISILVASILISMLLSLLTMSLKAKAKLDVENKMYTESYIISERLQKAIFDKGAHTIELHSNTASETTIYIHHDYDVYVDPVTHIISYPPSSDPPDILIFDKVSKEITYNGDVLHDSSILIDDGSVLELVSIDPATCDLTVAGTICDQGIIKLTLYIRVIFQNGANLEPFKFETSIIF